MPEIVIFRVRSFARNQIVQYCLFEQQIFDLFSLSRDNYRDGTIAEQLLGAKAVPGNYKKEKQKCAEK